MSVSSVETRARLRNFERAAIGAALAATAAFEAARGGGHAALAGLAAALALLLLRGRDRPISVRLAYAAVDFLAVVIFSSLIDPALALWSAPQNLPSLFHMTAVGAGASTFLYGAAVGILAGRAPWAIRLALFALPFLFCLIVAIGSPAEAQIGSLFLLKLDVPTPFAAFVGRVYILFLLNEAVVVGAPLALGRFLPREWRPHLVLFFSAALAALTPYVASSVSLFIAPLSLIHI